MSSNDDGGNGGNIKDIDTLTDNEIKILKEKFGVDISSEASIEEVISQFDIIRERIRRIEEKALKKLNPGKNDPGDNDPK